ncbi:MULTISPECIES: hypothetical protein [unclassified Sphingopyxis]|uniref:hypothetical protein n=1 Tax=unclassified Sphingopyxis TaxID=2614943 RepID=UPI003012C4B4
MPHTFSIAMNGLERGLSDGHHIASRKAGIAFSYRYSGKKHGLPVILIGRPDEEIIMPKIHMLTGSFAAMLLCSASMVAASGTVSSPERQQTMESFDACLAYLEDSAAQDSKSEAPLSGDAEGNRRIVTIERRTDGIERSGKASAHYGARVWYSNGRPRPDLGQIEWRASWEEHDYKCRGRMLIINTSQGYTLESYQPMEAGETAESQR